MLVTNQDRLSQMLGQYKPGSAILYTEYKQDQLFQMLNEYKQGSAEYAEGTVVSNAEYKQGPAVSNVEYKQGTAVSNAKYKQGTAVSNAECKQGTAVSNAKYKQGTAVSNAENKDCLSKMLNANKVRLFCLVSRTDISLLPPSPPAPLGQEVGYCGVNLLSCCPILVGAGIVQ